MGEVQFNSYNGHKYMGHICKSLLFLRCFLDSLVTRSKSKFWARTHGNKLQFQFEAFMFSEITEDVNVSNSNIHCCKPQNYSSAITTMNATILYFSNSSKLPAT